MRIKNYILLCIAVAMFVSCVRNRENPSENVPPIPQEEKQIDLYAPATAEYLNVPVTAEQMRDFLYENDSFIRGNREITFIEKVNFGIPGGGNWIVRYNDRFMSVYSIDGNEIIKQYILGSFNLEDHSIFDIMQDIPGKRIDNSTISIGDFNNDGINEIFSYSFLGRGKFIFIDGYDESRDDFVSYCEVPFKILDKEYGPAPVEFLTYNGVYGFKVYFLALDVPGGPGYIREPIPNNDKWIFYTWDAGQREYVEVGEFIEQDTVE
jgi:hypothetical protein